MYISPYTALDAAFAASEKSKLDNSLAVDERATVINLLSEVNNKEESHHATDQAFILGYN
ncbi:MAG: hypothetical protein ACTJH9_08950 [Pseudoalteromonas sp.]|uniref:hypothetical protein n=1 Tax=unclassified Pseudoalteromonas TaxID=194690 RepID=UPI003F9CB659